MPLIIEVHPDNKYVYCQYIGDVTVDEIYSAVKKFYESDDWIPGMPELIDLSQFDNSRITSTDIASLAQKFEKLYQEKGLQPFKISIFASKPLDFGLGRMYRAYSDESPETVGIFKTIEEAKAFLIK